MTSDQAGNSPVVVQVDLTVTAATIVSASPASLHFAYTQLGAVPLSQPVSITFNTPVGFTTSVSPNTPWLSATAGGTTPGIVTVAVDPTSLAAGDYEGQVLVNAPGASNTPLIIPVTLSVSAAPFLQARPTQLTFAYQLGKKQPTSQALTITSSGSPINVTATSSGESWLSVAGTGGLTPAIFTVSVDGSQLTAGTYQAQVVVASSGAANSPLTVPVTLTVTAAPTLITSPQRVDFSYQIGQSLPPNQQVTVSSSEGALNYTINASTNSGGAWLSAQGGTATPSIVDVKADPTGLASGTYTGQITLSSSGAGNSPLAVPVTLVVTDAITLIASPTKLSFVYEPPANAPPSQQILITSSGVQAIYSASVAAAAPWLTVTGNSATPGTLTVSVNPTGLTPGDYEGTVVILCDAAANNPLEVPVLFRVVAAPSLNVSPNVLRFAYLIQGSPPVPQTLTVTSTGSSLNFQATVSGGAPWIQVTGGGATPGTLQVSVNPTGLGVGTYAGAILVASTNGDSFEVAVVTLSVTSLPNLSTSPSSLSFQYQTQGSLPAEQTLLVTSDSGNPIVTASATTFSGGPWLSAIGSGATPFSVAVSVTPAWLSPGVYYGEVALTSSSTANSSYSVPVSLTVTTAPALSATPNSLTFAFRVGDTAPPPSQQVRISSDTSIPVSVTASTANGVPWLSAAYAGSSTPLSVTVSVDPAGLSSGTYSGTISVSSPVAGVSPLLIPVTFSLSAQPVIQAAPSAASFVYMPGGALPAPIPILISSDHAVNVTPSVSPPVSWLSVSGGGPTPATLELAANPVGLAPGVYTSAVLVTSTGASNSPLSIPISLMVVSGPALTAAPSALLLTVGLHETIAASFQVQSTGAPLVFTAAASSNTPWLSVSATGTTPANITVQASAAGLTPGTYAGAVIVTAAGAVNSPMLVPVIFTVQGAPTLTANPPTISFSSFSGGGGGAQSQTVTVLLNGHPATNSQSLQLRPSTWMSVQPAAGGSFLVTADPSAVPPGEYLAGVAVTEATASNSPILVPVRLSVVGIPVQSSAPSVALASATGTNTASTDVIRLGGGPADFSVEVTGSTWLKVAPVTGTIPINLTISADPTGLAPGSYQGAVTIHAQGAADNVVSVVLGVGSPTTPVVSPQRLTFRSGLITPAAQSVAVASVNAGIGLQVTTADSWLSVDTPSITTPARFGVSVSTTNSAPGQYHSQIILTQAGNAAPAAAIPVDFYVGQPGLPRISGITSSASFYLPPALAPGLLFSVFGAGLGPSTPVVPTVSGGLLPTSANGVQVFLDGVPCPLLYISDSQINAVAPFALDGDTNATVVVQYLGINSDPVSLPGTATAPGIFTLNATGAGAGSILNLDNTVNSPSNPANRGSFVAIYAAGGGQTTPPGLDGSFYTAAGSKPNLPVTVQVGGIDAEVSYAGAAPTFCPRYPSGEFPHSHECADRGCASGSQDW